MQAPWQQLAKCKLGTKTTTVNGTYLPVFVPYALRAILPRYAGTRLYITTWELPLLICQLVAAALTQQGPALIVIVFRFIAVRCFLIRVRLYMRRLLLIYAILAQPDVLAAFAISIPRLMRAVVHGQG